MIVHAFKYDYCVALVHSMVAIVNGFCIDPRFGAISQLCDSMCFFASGINKYIFCLPPPPHPPIWRFIRFLFVHSFVRSYLHTFSFASLGSERPFCLVVAFCNFSSLIYTFLVSAAGVCSGVCYALLCSVLLCCVVCSRVWLAGWLVG